MTFARKAYADRLLDLSYTKADVIAENWAKAIITNSHTPSYHSIPVKELVERAIPFYKNIRSLYFAENTYAETLKFMETVDYTSYHRSRGIPLHEAIYGLILMRRHIWLYADMQAVFYSEGDIYQSVISVNRALVIYDYAIIILAAAYEK
jgi:hypothetical protein